MNHQSPLKCALFAIVLAFTVTTAAEAANGRERDAGDDAERGAGQDWVLRIEIGNGEQPAGYHWVNFLLHLANVLLVFALARRLIREDLASFFIAALWAVHPLLTESVTNIIGRSDLIAGFAILSGLLMSSG